MVQHLRVLESLWQHGQHQSGRGQHGRRHRQRAAWQSQSRRSNRRHAEEQRPARLGVHGQSQRDGSGGVGRLLRRNRHPFRLQRRSGQRRHQQQASPHARILREREGESDFAENHRPRRDRGRPHRQQHLRLHRQRRARQSRQLGQRHYQRQHQRHRQRNHRRTRQHQAERRHDPLRNRGSRHPVSQCATADKSSTQCPERRAAGRGERRQRTSRRIHRHRHSANPAQHAFVQRQQRAGNRIRTCFPSDGAIHSQHQPDLVGGIRGKWIGTAGGDRHAKHHRQQCETAREAQIRQRQRAIPANHQQTGEYQQHGSRNTRRPQNPEREHTGHSRQRIQTVHRFQHRHAELAQKRRHGAQRHQFRRTAATEFRAGLAGWDGRNTCRHRDQPGQRGQANQHRARPTRPSGVRHPHRP